MKPAPGTGLRISGGDLRGKRLAVPPGLAVRPMRSRVREALFNMLGGNLRAARVLDVFSGSGAIAIEAISRGAIAATLIENGAEVLPVLRANLQGLLLERRCQVLEVDAYGAESTIASALAEPLDLVFLDPPFADYELASPGRNPWQLAFSLGLRHLKPGGHVGLEIPSEFTPPSAPVGLELRVDRRYGDTKLVLWRRTG
ncbi:MAG: 16S rRNA (guanine(966)-N(2))-methyltransferase RsmD [Planctomycetota bacterium]